MSRAIHPKVSRARAKVAVRTREGDLAGADEARAELREANAEADVQRLVDAWPPLSDAQRARLALLLAPGADA
jgi:hypothetical protein